MYLATDLRNWLHHVHLFEQKAMAHCKHLVLNWRFWLGLAIAIAVIAFFALLIMMAPTGDRPLPMLTYPGIPY
jgi:predicted anti-sigma-YlaC factor YlaD